MKPRNNHATRFKSTGIGITSKQAPICVMFPGEFDEILRSLPNRSEYIRDVVIRALKEDGFLESAPEVELSADLDEW